MTMLLTAVTALFVDLPAQELTGWIERGWVQPRSLPDPAGCSRKSTSPRACALIHDLRRVPWT